MSTYLETPYHGIHTFKTPSRTKLFKSRALNDENSAYVYPQTVKKSGRKPLTPGKFLATGHKSVARRLNSHKGVVGLNPLSEITNKTPHQRKITEKTISKSFELLDISNVELETSPSTRRLSSTRKTRPLGSASKCFKTPVSGNPWDVSDGSIEVAHVDELVPLEDEDDVEYCPPTALAPDHGLNLEFPDYTIGRNLFNKITSDEIPHRTYQVDLTTEVYELELPSLLVEEIDILVPEIVLKKGQMTQSKEAVDCPVNNNWRGVKSKTAVGHSRIPSLSRQYYASAKDSISAKKSTPMDLRSNQTTGSDMRIQSLRTRPLVNPMTTGLRKPEQIIRFKPVDVVTDSVINSPPEVEDVFFEL